MSTTLYKTHLLYLMLPLFSAVRRCTLRFFLLHFGCRQLGYLHFYCWRSVTVETFAPIRLWAVFNVQRHLLRCVLFFCMPLLHWSSLLLGSVTNCCPLCPLANLYPPIKFYVCTFKEYGNLHRQKFRKKHNHLHEPLEVTVTLRYSKTRYTVFILL